MKKTSIYCKLCLHVKHAWVWIIQDNQFFHSHVKNRINISVRRKNCMSWAKRFSAPSQQQFLSPFLDYPSIIRKFFSFTSHPYHFSFGGLMFHIAVLTGGGRPLVRRIYDIYSTYIRHSYSSFDWPYKLLLSSILCNNVHSALFCVTFPLGGGGGGQWMSS